MACAIRLERYGDGGLEESHWSTKRGGVGQPESVPHVRVGGLPVRARLRAGLESPIRDHSLAVCIRLAQPAR